jgi:hypothetical protein
VDRRRASASPASPAADSVRKTARGAATRNESHVPSTGTSATASRPSTARSAIRPTAFARDGLTRSAGKEKHAEHDREGSKGDGHEVRDEPVERDPMNHHAVNGQVAALRGDRRGQQTPHPHRARSRGARRGP